MTFTPMKLSLSREPKYKSVLKNYMKQQYLMTNKPRVSASDRVQLAQLADQLDAMDQSGYAYFHFYADQYPCFLQNRS